MLSTSRRSRRTRSSGRTPSNRFQACATRACPRHSGLSKATASDYASLPGTSRSVIAWVKRLTTTGRLRESLFTAATGRRAVEHPPQPGFHWRRGFALSVVNVTGHLPFTASLGDQGVTGRHVMTKDASFKKVVRRHAEETGQRYTEALTELNGLGARMNNEPAAERLRAHLRDRYGMYPVAAAKLSVHKT